MRTRLIAVTETMIVIAMVAFVSGCSYNTFTTQEEAIKAQWAQVQNQLQRRNDLIPNLVETVKGYASHEAGVFKDIADARSRLLSAKSPEETMEAANQQTSALGRLLAIAENYPNLKANEQFNRLMDELSGTENRIAVERMRYNQRVQEYDTARRQFPANLTAKVFGFKEYPFFQAAPEAKQAPKVNFTKPSCVPVAVPRPWERLLWSGRPSAFSMPLTWRERYLLTDFRLLRIGLCEGDHDEIPVQEIAEVHCSEARLDRLIGTSTVSVHARDITRRPLVLRHVRQGAQVAAILEVLAGDPHARVDPEAAMAALAWRPREPSGSYREALAATIAGVAAVFAVVIRLHGKSSPIAYPPDDEISPNGQKRPREEIVRFMNDEVMPWARVALGPLKGGADQVRCETCHGGAPEAQDWHMPGVAALPEPMVKDR